MGVACWYRYGHIGDQPWANQHGNSLLGAILHDTLSRENKGVLCSLARVFLPSLLLPPTMLKCFGREGRIGKPTYSNLPLLRLMRTVLDDLKIHCPAPVAAIHQTAHFSFCNTVRCHSPIRLPASKTAGFPPTVDCE